MSDNVEVCDVEKLCLDTIRILAAEAVQKANSGHPGAPMGLAAAGHTLFAYSMCHNPANPKWVNRDRFVLSGGHASMLLYNLLFLSGYGLTLDDIKNFRQWGSKTPGHPEYKHTVGVETTTGPLGQGLANAVGFAMAEAHLAARYNRPNFPITDHYTYAICGDGDLMEGLSSEAASLGGHLKLGKLICLYDSNRISIEGGTDLAFTENVAARFTAFGWQVLEVTNGQNVEQIRKAVENAKLETARPTLIILHTIIGYGSPNKQGSAATHGAPLGTDEITATKQNLNWPHAEPFYVPQKVSAFWQAVKTEKQTLEDRWNRLFADYKTQYPSEAAEFDRVMAGELPPEWTAALPEFETGAKLATRAASGKIINAAAKVMPELFGGSADLAPSNNTHMEGMGDFSAKDYAGRNIHFGVREHAMGAITNGLCLHGGLKVYDATFLVFADYMRNAIRLSALMQLPVTHVMTHDSVAVGEDGPTHQPVEHLASLRIIPNLNVIRPCDARETVGAWQVALNAQTTPTLLALSRQNLPVLSKTSAADVKKGAYVVYDEGEMPDLLIIATGSEVSLAVQAAEILTDRHIRTRVVSMPCRELFEAMPQSYRNEILPPEVTKRLVIEAGVSFGWRKYAGEQGKILGIDHFGASAPGDKVLAEFGFTVDNVLKLVDDM